MLSDVFSRLVSDGIFGALPEDIRGAIDGLTGDVLGTLSSNQDPCGGQENS